MTATAVDVPVWLFYDVSVARVRRLSPSFVRVTFAGDDLLELADNGYDQRVKLLLPAPDGGFAHLASGPSWYTDWRRLPDERRPPIRTYTVREVRTLPSGAREVDIDMVLHGETGPASRFAARAEPGDRAMLLGPNSRYAGRHGGLEFRPPAGHVGPTLLAGDETAVPALAAIVESLPADARGVVCVEVPDSGDEQEWARPAGVDVRWYPRAGAPRGKHLTEGVAEALRALRPVRDTSPRPSELDDVDVDTEVLWEVPEGATGSIYGFLAGEAGVIKRLRRLLIDEHGVPKQAVAFMGYWREGRW